MHDQAGAKMKLFFNFYLVRIVFFGKCDVKPCFDKAKFDSKKMKKMAYWLLFFLMLYFHGGAVNANSMIFEEYAWTNRLVIMITNKKNTDLEKQVRRFFESRVCDIDDRNLKLLHFDKNELAVTHLPKKMRSRTGLWLLGYDGAIKDFSEDEQLLKRLFQTIDGMSIRKDEMLSGPACS